jgi:hypothetical protein
MAARLAAARTSAAHADITVRHRASVRRPARSPALRIAAPSADARLHAERGRRCDGIARCSALDSVEYCSATVDLRV